VTCDHDENRDDKPEQKKPQQALTHGDYPLKRCWQAPGCGLRHRSRDVGAIVYGAVIDLDESIGSGITMQDKVVMAERNPLCCVGALRDLLASPTAAR
jgi:hypothetical protein